MRRAALAFAAALVAAPAVAEFPDEAHIAELEGCLVAAAEHPESCKGIISGPCMKAPAGEAALDRAQCLAGERAAWYEVIRDVYGELEAQVLQAQGATAVEQLREAQSAWVAHRNADCAMRAALADDLRQYEAACTMAHTAERAIALIALRGQ